MEGHTLSDLIGRLAEEGLTGTPFEGLRLFRLSQPIPPTHGTIEPSICGAVQGKKRVHLGGASYDYDSTHYLCCTMPIPAEGEVVEASPECPVLGFLLTIDTAIMTETVIEMETQATIQTPTEVVPGLSVAAWDPGVIAAMQRVLELVDDPLAARVLGRGRMKELMFALLRGDAGPSIRQALGASRDVSRAVSYLKENLSESVSIDDLAKRAGMSRAVFHRKFKLATSYSPIQFIKAVRLNQAAMLIAGGSSVTDAAYQVGYASQSQFSREFRRQFGRTPGRWRGVAGADGVALSAVS